MSKETLTLNLFSEPVIDKSWWRWNLVGPGTRYTADAAGEIMTTNTGFTN